MKRLISSIKHGLLRLVRSPTLQKLLQFVTNTTARFVKTDKALVLCGAMNGKLYGDNSKYIYEWLLMQNDGARPVWITRNRDVYRDLKRRGRPVVLSTSLAGWICLMRARVGVFTNSLYDLAMLPSLIPQRVSLIALRHGRSVKRIRFARQGHVISELEKYDRLLESRLIRYAISTSEMISDMQEECLQIGREKHVVTGYPRNDLLDTPTSEDVAKWQDFIGKEATDSKVILYAPSWRHGREATKFFPFSDFDIPKLCEFLEKQNSVLLLRPHMNDLYKYPDLVDFLSALCGKSDRIRLAGHDVFADVNSILPFADVLVSDYSALYHDFLLLDRPLLFVPYDFDEFSRQNGFLYNYEALLPGPRLNSMSAFFAAVAAAAAGNDTHQQQRHRLKQMIHQHDDANSRQRVCKLIEQIQESA
ncbi:CDP-glycerol glycerophosphotransferase family protein [Methylophaga sp. OBS1]|uniref:CDP-glycerol glycerophosphotransferase family protein n=1 Tax=Methylophaga sp. OBS1 TaxID=2991933 RepID=UPI00224F57E6|nr:CDP-glycerol glycerophosphotransferase family protein [Methylophaga sp. OBS1]MCX4193372.1 CDP-glycerol glycerophosphotransferase family protein [Methylophaga sp. OBS1]